MTRFGPSTRQQSLGVVVSAALMLMATLWLLTGAATPSRVTTVVALQLLAAILGVWIARSHITLEPDHLTIVHMRTRRIPYHEISAVNVENLRSRVVVLTLQDGTTAAVGPSAGLDVEAIAEAIRERLRQP